eukprot:gene25472-biopygen9033
MPAPRPRHLPVPPGGTGHWRGRGAFMARAWRGHNRHFLAWGGAGMAWAWRGHFPRGPPLLVGTLPRARSRPPPGESIRQSPCLRRPATCLVGPGLPDSIVLQEAPLRQTSFIPEGYCIPRVVRTALRKSGPAGRCTVITKGALDKLIYDVHVFGGPHQGFSPACLCWLPRAHATSSTSMPPPTTVQRNAPHPAPPIKPRWGRGGKWPPDSGHPLRIPASSSATSTSHRMARLATLQIRLAHGWTRTTDRPRLSACSHPTTHPASPAPAPAPSRSPPSTNSSFAASHVEAGRPEGRMEENAGMEGGGELTGGVGFGVETLLPGCSPDSSSTRGRPATPWPEPGSSTGQPGPSPSGLAALAALAAFCCPCNP